MRENKKAFFSIIVPHFEGSVSSERLHRGLGSLHAQTFQDFNIVLLHDGPKEIPFSEELGGKGYDKIAQMLVTERRYNDFGHSLRDIGLALATGEYIVHFNADNVLYDFALEALYDAITADLPTLRIRCRVRNANDIVIFPVIMKGMALVGDGLIRDRHYENDFDVVLSGAPARKFNIDVMQLVMRRSRWLEVGGWYEKTEQADAKMYPKLVRRFGARYLSRILGEHW
jgi:hypothetical protein